MPTLPKLILAAGAVILIAVPSSCANKSVEAPEARPRTPEEERIVADFKKRVDQYESISGTLEREVYPQTSEADAATIYARQKELASRIVEALPDWTEGAIFTPEIAAFFRKRITGVVTGPGGANVKGAIFDDAPGEMTVKVLTEYPTGVPIATAPAQMLELFPAIPIGLEYRFLGSKLILMDVAAFLIVDIVPDAIK